MRRGGPRGCRPRLVLHLGGTTLATLSEPISSTATRPLSLLVLSETGDWPLAVRELVAAHSITATKATSVHQACDPAVLSKADAVVVCDLVDDTISIVAKNAAEARWSSLQLLGDALLAHRLTGVVLSQGMADKPYPEEGAFLVVPPDVSADELWGRVATIRQYRPLFSQFEQQVATMQRLGKKLNQQFVAVDQELRLASRLQRDFLPKSFPEVGDIRFAAMYHPAAWVSGDMYDVARLDETHVGFYLADAVGHGIAAGLLTMFIKQAVVGKRIDRNSYTLTPPSDVLSNLNVDLAHQELPNCQFVTALYGLINTRDCTLSFARGGHPHPVHVTADGQCSEIMTVGGLLGVFAEETFPSTSLALKPGEKFVIYSDGVEDAIIARRDRNKGTVEFTSSFRELVRSPIDACIASLSAQVQHAEGSLAPADDMTILGIERRPS